MATWAAIDSYVDEFDEAAPSWELANPASVGQIVRQERRAIPGSDISATFEQIAVICPPGQSLIVRQRIKPHAVIDETRVMLRVRTNRPGVCVAAQVVLPRNRSVGLSSPTLLVRGSNYEPRGDWQELELRDLPRLVARQARVLRSSAGPQIDEREAYVDQVALIVPGGPGVTELWIDRLVVEGVAAHSPSQEESDSESIGPEFPDGGLSPAGASSNRVQSVRMASDQLSVDNRAIFPRLVQYHGEDLELLARCGFNGVWLPEPPTSKQLSGAQKLGIGLIAPPPEYPLSAEDAPRWNAVWAWDLGKRLSLPQVDAVAAHAQALRRRDSVLQRPLVASPSDSLDEYSRVVDILQLGRRASLHDASISSWSNALAETIENTRLGTPMWVSIHLDHSEEVIRQLQILAPQAATTWQTPRRLARQTHTALGRPVSGIVFASSHSLSDSDPSTQVAVAACELLNRELQLIEPWLVSGASTGEAACSDPDLQAIVRQRDRVRLISLQRRGPATGGEEPSQIGASHSITVPGVPESARAYVLTPGGMRAVPHQRVSGGVRVALAEVPPGAYVVLTDDPTAVATLMRSAAQGSRRAAQLARVLALEETRQAEQITMQLQQVPAAKEVAQRLLAAGKTAIGGADVALVSGNSESAYRQLLVARDQIAALEASLLLQSTSAPKLASNPLVGSLSRLLDEWKLDLALASLPPGNNLLYGGDCEELAQMQSHGWTHTRFPLPEIETTVELTTDKPQQGARALRLVAKSDDAARRVAGDAAAVWVATPDVQVEAGQTLEISGWVWAPALDSGRLTISDSLGGEELALQMNQTPDWQPFRMIRTVPKSGAVQVQFALSGIGEARVDGVMIRLVLPVRGQPPRRLPALPVGNTP